MTGPISIGQDSAYQVLTCGQTSCTDGATVIVTVSGDRAKLVLSNTETNVNIFVAPTTSVTTSNGFCIPPLTAMLWPYAGALYGITTGSGDLSFAELGR